MRGVPKSISGCRLNFCLVLSMDKQILARAEEQRDCCPECTCRGHSLQFPSLPTVSHVLGWYSVTPAKTHGCLPQSATSLTSHPTQPSSIPHCHHDSSSSHVTIITAHRTSAHPSVSPHLHISSEPCSRALFLPAPHASAGPGLCRMSPGLQRLGLNYSEAGPHTQQPALVSCTHGTPGVRSSHGPQAWSSVTEAEQGHSLPVCIFGNRTRIKLKEDDAHGLQGWLCSHGHKVCGKRRTMNCEQ